MADAIVRDAVLDQGGDGLTCYRQFKNLEYVVFIKKAHDGEGWCAAGELVFAGACAYISGQEFMQARVHASRLGE